MDQLHKPARLPDHVVTRVAAEAICTRESVRKFLRTPERMHASTRDRVAKALRELGLLEQATGAREG